MARIHIRDVPPGNSIPEEVRRDLFGLSVPYDKKIQNDLTALRALHYSSTELGHVLKVNDLARALRESGKDASCEFMCNLPEKYLWIPSHVSEVLEHT